MADKPYKVMFNWSGVKGNLTAVSCDHENIPKEGNIGRKLANWWQQLGIVNPGESDKAALTMNKSQTIQLRRGGFLYMDVGCWINGQQTFGLVWSDEAAICSYKPIGYTPDETSSQKQMSSSDIIKGNLIDVFLKDVPGVSLIKRKKILGKYPQDAKKLLLILPDMHVPESPPLDCPRPPQKEGQNEVYWSIQNEQDGTSYKVNPFRWDHMVKHDLFNSRKSIDAMTEFLGETNRLCWINQIDLVQLGDMYELWAARPCLLKQTPEDDPRIEIIPSPKLSDKCRTREEAINNIGSWIGNTHLIYFDLFGAFTRSLFASKVFLYGNHDSYLTVPEVVTVANNYIKSQTSKTTVVYPRQQSFTGDSVFVEHGQRVDTANRDGETKGFGFAGFAADHETIGGVMKKSDPTRRETFVTGAAAYWTVNGANFGIYIQGHTHEADLNYVEVYHRREDINVVFDPYGFSSSTYTTHEPIGE